MWDVAAGDEGDGNTHTEDERGDTIHEGDRGELGLWDDIGEVEDTDEETAPARIMPRCAGLFGDKLIVMILVGDAGVGFDFDVPFGI